MASVEMHPHQEAAVLHMQNYSFLLYQLMLSYAISYSDQLLLLFMEHIPYWLDTYEFESLSVSIPFVVILDNIVPPAPTGNEGGEELDDLVYPFGPLLAPQSHPEHTYTTWSTNLLVVGQLQTTSQIQG